MNTAFIFPGQGSQSIQMMAPFAELAIVRDTFSQASDILGEDLWALVENGPVDTLNQTINTQPVMLSANVAIYRAWLERGGKKPEYVAGHSLGEYAAFVASGVLDFADAIKAIRVRATLMTEAMPTGGAMAAVLGLDQEPLGQVCCQAAKDQVVEMVNFNAPGQIVIAGNAEAVERAAVLAKEAGAKRVAMLPVSGPFHSSLMRGAADKMADHLATVQVSAPQIPLLHNVDATSHTEVETIRQLMSKQMCSAVQWIATVKNLEQAGVARLIECGPGKVLTGLGKRISPELQHLVLSDLCQMDDLISGETV